MSEPTNLQRQETKRRRQTKPERHDARKFIAPIQAQIREAFSNTGNSEHLGRHFDATIRSVVDTWGSWILIGAGVLVLAAMAILVVMSGANRRPS